MRLRRPLALLVAVLCLASGASAQPSTLPLVQAAHVTYLGSFTAPASDGSGRGNNEGSLLYGGNALGIGADGQSLYFRCHDWHDQLARITIPAMGGVASVVQPCRPVPVSLVHPGASTAIGGSLVWNNRLIITGVSTYDASGGQSQSHFWADLGTTAIQGPARLTTAPRRVSGYMGIVPPEWRAALGGPVLTGVCCLSIISTTSAGPAVSTFDPDQLGAVTPPVPSSELLFYPVDSFPTNWRTMEMGGVAFPAGTRSVLFIGRMGEGAACYGYGTSNQALAGTYHADGTLYCLDPTSSAKGYHAYPYVHRIWAYDANHLAEVKAGIRAATSVVPYAAWNLSGMELSAGDARIRSATYDPATRRIYVTAFGGSTTPRVYVWAVANLAPQPVDATYGPWSEWAPVGAWTACQPDGTRTRSEQRTRTELTPAQYGGVTQPTSESRTVSESCAFDATYTDWSAWMTVHEWSGGLVETSTRTLVLPAVNGGTTGPTERARVTMFRD